MAFVFPFYDHMIVCVLKLCKQDKLTEKVALELALSKRYKYQVTQRSRSLGRMLKRAVKQKDIDMKQSARVRERFDTRKQHFEMMAEFITMDEPSLQSIADNRGDLRIDLLPKQRDTMTIRNSPILPCCSSTGKPDNQRSNEKSRQIVRKGKLLQPQHMN